MRPLRAVVLAELFLLLSVPLPGNAAASAVDFTVTSISPFVGKDRPLQIDLVVSNTGDIRVEEAAIRLTLHGRVRTRSDLRQALDGDPGTDVIAVTTEQLEEPLRQGERRVVKLERDLGTLASPFRRPQDGVYPLGIQLRVAGETIEESATAIPFLFGDPRSKLNIVTVVPIHVPAAFDARGDYEVGGLDRAVQEGGRLDMLLAALEAHPSAPLTIAPTALTLDQLADLGDGYVARDSSGRHAVTVDDPVATAARESLERLRLIAGSAALQTVSSTYARADAVGLTHNGMPEELRAQFARERELDSLLLGREPVAEVFVPADFDLDARSAVEVARQGVRTVILAPESLPGRRTRFGYDRTESVTGGGRVRFTALIVDDAIRDRLILKSEPVLAAQGAIAETASSYFELPSLAAERLLVIATPVSPDPFVAKALLDGLTASPWIQLRTATEAATLLEPSDEPVALPLRRAPDRAPLVAARSARRVVETLGAVLQEERPIEALQRSILAAESADWIRAPGQGSILARAARGTAERQLALIKVAERHVTLTSRIAQIPVTIINDTGRPVQVRIALNSAKISFPDGPARTIEVSQQIATITFRAETRVTGSFPVTVRILTPDGAAPVGQGELIVRSTAVSAVTLAATGGGVVVLLAGWIRRLVRTRRKRATAQV